jgi:hypothetical protein
MISDHNADRKKPFSVELTMDRFASGKLVSGVEREQMTREKTAERGKGDFDLLARDFVFPSDCETLLHLSSVFKLTQIIMNVNSSRSLVLF